MPTPSASAPRASGPRLSATDVRAAYRRWSGIYDASFGAISAAARARAIDLVNADPGTRVLEAGVGTGLSLPLYAPGKRVTGIDLSADMLARARARVDAAGLTHVDALLECDAQDTGLPAASFQIAVAMFVASVVPDPRALLAEMRRLVVPGGLIAFVNHFSATGGPRLWAERGLAPAGRLLGWHPDFPIAALLTPAEQALATSAPMPPAGLFTLVSLRNA